jgi:hypothetical protein
VRAKLAVVHIPCCVCLWAMQMVLDPSNMRPLFVCGVAMVSLFGLLVTAQFLSTRRQREQRRLLYCKSGSFSCELPLPDVPQDVRGCIQWFTEQEASCQT